MSKLERWKFLMPLTLAVLFVAAMVGGAWANEFAVYTDDWAGQVEVATPAADQSSGCAVVDENGNTYVAYVEGGDVKAQKLNSAGVQQWTASGITALDIGTLTTAKIAYVGSGYIVIVGEDQITDKLYVQKINANGALQWPTATPSDDGIDVGATADTDGEYQVVSDSAGTVVVAWVDASSGANPALGASRIKSDGTFSYQDIDVIAATADLEPNVWMVKGSTGVVIVGGILNTPTGTDDTPDTAWYAVFVDTAGTKAQVTVLSDDTSTAETEIGDFDVVSDGAGGAVFVGSWASDATGSTFRVQAAWVNSSGIAKGNAQISTSNTLSAANSALYGTQFMEMGSTDYVAIVWSEDAGTNTSMNLYKIGSLGGTYLPKKWAAHYDVDAAGCDNAAKAGSLKIADAGASETGLTWSDNTGVGHVNGLLVGSDADGTAAQEVFAASQVDDNTDDTLTNTALVSGSLYGLWLDNTVTAAYYAMKFHNEPKIDIAFANTLTAVSPTPFVISLDAGGTIQVKDKLINNGDLDATDITVNYYLANAATYAGATKRLLLDSRTVGSLEAGKSESSVVTTTLDIPADNEVGGGALHIIAYANQTGVATEATSGDNESPLGITISSPNLKPFSIVKTAPAGNMNLGDTITIQDKVQNTGNVDAGAFKIKYYLVNNTDDGAGINTGNLLVKGTYLGERSISSLAAGATDEVTTDLTIPATFDFGDAFNAFIYVYVDADKAVTESVDADNVNVTAGDGKINQFFFLPQLQVTALAVNPLAFGPGDNVTITDTASNAAGTKAASDIVVKYYIDPTGDAKNTRTEADIKIKGKLLGSRTISSLGIGETDSAATDVTIPVDASDGALQIYAYIDPDNSIVEDDEKDNISGGAAGEVSSVPVTMNGQVDLITTAVSVSDNTVNAGDNIDLNYAVKNQGGKNAGASTTGFYLSSDATYDVSGDVFLGNQVVTDINAGATVAVTGINAPTVMIPSGTTDGTYYIMIVANYDGGVDEYATDNNSKASATLTIGEVAVLTATPTSVSIASAGGTADVAIGGGATPYSIVTQPDAGVATATLVDATLTVTAVADGSTSVVVKDNSSPAQTVTIPVTVAPAAAAEPANPATPMDGVSIDTTPYPAAADTPVSVSEGWVSIAPQMNVSDCTDVVTPIMYIWMPSPISAGVDLSPLVTKTCADGIATFGLPNVDFTNYPGFVFDVYYGYANVSGDIFYNVYEVTVGP